MEFKCSVCNYTSYKKANVARHIIKTVLCGEGIRQIIVIPGETNCTRCNRSFKTKQNLDDHINNNICGIRNFTTRTEPTVNTVDLSKKIDELTEEVKKLQLEKAAPMIINNNNNNNYTFIVHNYYNTDLSMLTDEDYKKIIDEYEGYQMIPEFTKLVHFNVKFPQNHNICITNYTRNNKHVKVIKDGIWQLTNKDTQINNLAIEKESNLNEWVSGPGAKYTETAEKFNDYMETKNEEDDKIVKEELELILYNGGKMINQ